MQGCGDEEGKFSLEKSELTVLTRARDGRKQENSRFEKES